jgi:hypothetical protein
MTDHTQAFRPIIFLFVQQINKTKDSIIKKKLNEALKDTLKKMTDQPVQMVSEAAWEACQAKKLNPFDLMWPDRNILGKDITGKSLLLWEHTTPIGELYEILIKCKSEVEIQDTLENYSGVCWIMRYEDNLLNENGFRSKRPEGWQKAYEACGIKIVRKC